MSTIDYKHARPENKELQESLQRIRAQIATVENDRRYSDEYRAEFKAARMRDFESVVTMARRQTRDKALALREKAKDDYLLASLDSGIEEERFLFEKFVAASPDETIAKLAGKPGELENWQTLMLASELRHRGLSSEADALFKMKQPTHEPWTLSQEWKQAEVMLSEFSGCEHAEANAGRTGLVPGVRVKLSDGNTATAGQLLL